MQVESHDLRDAIRALPKLGFAGVNLTVPHKEIAILMADETEESAAKIGAANTLFFRGGKIIASNTDAYGFIQNIKKNYIGWKPRNQKAVVLGSGGASRAVCYALLQEGFAEILLVNRTRDRAEKMANELSSKIKVEHWDKRSEILENAYIVVNTTTLGMEGFASLDIDLDRLPQDALVTDIVYTPLITDFLEAASERGNPIVDGLGMLLYQAKPGFSGWFGVEPEVDTGLKEYIVGLTR